MAMMPLRSSPRAALACRGALVAILALSSGSLGCAGYTQNVRAMRQYAGEEPNLAVALDRTEDMAKVAELVDRLLYATPFDPGDAWIQELPLDATKARALREELRGQPPYGEPGYAIPVAKLYRVHLERVLAKAGGAGSAPETTLSRPPRGEAPERADRYAKGPPAKGKPGGKPDKASKPSDKASKPSDDDEAASKPVDPPDAPAIDKPKATESAKKYASVLEAAATLSGSPELRGHFETHAQKVTALLAAEAHVDEVYDQVHPKGTIPQIGRAPDPRLVEAQEARDLARRELREAERELLADVGTISRSHGDAQTLKDVTIAVSVALRADLEALAMAPIVIVQATRAVAGVKGGDAAVSGLSLKTVKQVDEVPAYLEGLKERLSRQSVVLETLTASLAKASRTTVEDTAGFSLKESAVDQVVGVAADSFHVDLKAGGEMLFYSAKSNQYDPKNDQNPQNDKIIKNYNGRRFGLAYDVKPVTLLAGKIDVGFDWIKLPNAASLSLGFKTDRGIASNGDVQQGSFSKELGASGIASDALDLGLGILGVRTNVRLAKFTAGTVKLVAYDNAGNDTQVLDAATGKAMTAPFQIDYKQIDVGYDLAFLMGESAGKYYIEELTVGGRYFSYALPRIMYELEYTGPADASTKTYNYRTESGPQNVPSKYYMGGLTTRFGAGQAKAFSPFFDLGLYLGFGPTSYKMRSAPPTGGLQDTFDENQTLANHDQRDRSAFAANLTAALGARLRLARPGERLRIYGEAQYRGELIGSKTSGSEAKEGTERIVDTGTTDIFHGPRLSLVGEF